MDTFTLKLHITGLGLFAPDTTPKDGREPAMHLLLPKIPEGNGHPAHLARLYFDPADAPGHTGDAWVELDGFRWTPPAPEKRTPKPKLPAEIINISRKASANARIPYRQLKHAKQSFVASHIVLRHGAVATCRVPRARFTVGSKKEWLTNHLIWEILGLRREPFTVSLEVVREHNPPVQKPIVLVPRGNEMVLHLLNVPEQEHRAAIAGIEAAEIPACNPTHVTHFTAYRHLFRNATIRDARCVAIPFEPGACPEPSFPPNMGQIRAKVIYTCMLAAADLNPNDG